MSVVSVLSISNRFQRIGIMAFRGNWKLITENCQLTTKDNAVRQTEHCQNPVIAANCEGCLHAVHVFVSYCSLRMRVISETSKPIIVGTMTPSRMPRIQKK